MDEYDNLVTCTFDFLGLQNLLRTKFAQLNKQIADFQQHLRLLQEEQDNRVAWENMVMEKLKKLEKGMVVVPEHDSFMKMQNDLNKIKNTHADEMIGLQTIIVGAREELTTVNTEFVKLAYEMNENKAALQQAYNEIATRMNKSDEKQVQLNSSLDEAINGTKTLKARCDEFQNAMVLSTARADRTDRAMATEFATIATWRDHQIAAVRLVEDRVESVHDDVSVIKASLDDLTSAPIRRQLANISQETARLSSIVKELMGDSGKVTTGTTGTTATTVTVTGNSKSSANLNSGGGGSSPSPKSDVSHTVVPPPVAVQIIPKLNAEITSKINEQSKMHNDLRRDVSDMGLLMEAITSEVAKLKDTSSDADWLKILQDHSKQLSNLLQTKADVSVIETMLEQERTKLTPAEIEEFSALRELIQGKASRKELIKIKKKLEKGLVATQDPDASKSPLDGAITRVQLRCLSCDKIINPMEADGVAVSPYFDLSPNIALRRSRVKEMLRDVRSQSPLLPRASSTNSVGSTSSRRTLTPVTPRRPITAPSKERP